MQRLSTPSRDAGSFRGSLSHYRTRLTSAQAGETAERLVIQERAEDL